ncbi:CgeB family protein [Maribellus maritimus]|uniref:hypothetical protein n=1 Tax=Maribellus maritimus TaxID=2870838 RepID=UPI001EEABF1C|nr:hypothetical protein [Maribellus maritimus]MCG6191225.1 hypothetical protein [Maribellus maritimus]
MSFIKGKNIFFISSELHNYTATIKKEMEAQGAYVYHVIYKKKSRYFQLLRHLPKIKKKLENRIVRNAVKKSKNTNFDYVFIIRGGMLNPETILSIRKHSPTTKFILYLWDSISENNNVLNLLSSMNSIISFDILDCEKYGFKYLPLFYSKEFETKNIINSDNQFEYDLSFVGRDHSDRYKILKQIKLQAENLNLRIKIYLVISKLGYYKRKIFDSKNFRDANKDDFYFNTLTLSEISNIYKQSRCIIDIEQKVQTGLTMRTFEILAQGKKMVTTNQHIKKLDIYSPELISIVDRNDVKLDFNFIKNPLKTKYNIEKYSLSNWVKNIFLIANA